MIKKEYTVNPEVAGKQRERDLELEEGNYVNITENGIGKKGKKGTAKDIDLPLGQLHNDISAIEMDLDKDFEEVDEWGDHDYEDVDQEGNSTNVIGRVVRFIQKVILKTFELMQHLTKNHFFSVLFILGYFVYFIAAMIYKFGDDGSIRLLVCTILGVVIYTRIWWLAGLKWLRVKMVGKDGMNPTVSKWTRFVLRWVMYIALVAVTVWTIVDNATTTESLRGLPGLIFFLLLCLLFSRHPSKINWHTIFWGVGLQFVFALCTLKYEFGQDAIKYIQERLDEFFAHSQEASILILGPETHQHRMIFEALPIVFIVSSTLALLYYLGAMQLVITFIGGIFSFIMDTQPAESVSVAASIFLDGTAAVISLRPFLESQSKSQLFMIVTSCFASLGGATLALFSQLGVPLTAIVPAMVISAPATFATCKLVYPETRPKDSKLNKTDQSQAMPEEVEANNAMEAFRAGAVFGLPFIGNILAVAFSFVSAISWLNSTFTWFGERVGKKGFTLEYILSYLLYPLSLAMGIHPDECRLVARIMGVRFFSSNLVAFLDMIPMSINRKIYQAYMAATNNTGPVIHNGDDMFLVYFNKTLVGGMITERSEVITTFSLCGFSSILTMAFTIAVFFTLVPKRRVWLSEVAIPALVVGNIANCMTACVASIFY